MQVGGMGDVVTALGRAVLEEGHRVEVILPKFDCINYKEVGTWADARPLCETIFSSILCQIVWLMAQWQQIAVFKSIPLTVLSAWLYITLKNCVSKKRVTAHSNAHTHSLCLHCTFTRPQGHHMSPAGHLTGGL